MRFLRLKRVGDVTVVTLDAAPVNALSAGLRRSLYEAVVEAGRDSTVAAIVLIGAGRGFSGGADIREFGRAPQRPALANVIDAIEACSKPIVAALHGAALGGGLELALACHARVAGPSARMGLPEVKLGLLPGAGGTQRLPRLVGPEMALEMITSGSPIGASEAYKAGLIDAVIDQLDLEGGAIAYAHGLVGKPLRRVRDLSWKIAGTPAALFTTFRDAHARKFRGFEAPAKCVDAVEASVVLPFDEGLARERALFESLAVGEQSAAQRYVFFAERQAGRVDDLPNDTEVMPVGAIGIIGAGTMGTGIAMSFLDAGLPVTIVETEPDALDRGLAAIRQTYAASAKKGRITTFDAEARTTRLAGTLDLRALAHCDLVIEAVFEMMAAKKKVFENLDKIAKPGAILASNTSYLDIDEIAAVTGRPDHVVGLHFFSPANIMRLLEVVRSRETSKPVLATALNLARTIGKIAVVVGAGHGFVGNRMLAARQREAARLVVEGSMPWDVDRVLYAFGFPMGPFAMADLAGLDLGWARETSTSSTIREILCERGRRGQKTGRGFYDYDETRTATPSREVETVVLDFAARNGVTRRVIPDEEILERCLLPMINEGAQILDEGIAARASDIDVVWINGYGWPAYRGGPMYHADKIGIAHLVARLEALRAAHGESFTPSALLRRLATTNGSLTGA